MRCSRAGASGNRGALAVPLREHPPVLVREEVHLAHQIQLRGARAGASSRCDEASVRPAPGKTNSPSRCRCFFSDEAPRAREGSRARSSASRSPARRPTRRPRRAPARTPPSLSGFGSGFAPDAAHALARNIDVHVHVVTSAVSRHRHRGSPSWSRALGGNAKELGVTREDDAIPERA